MATSSQVTCSFTMDRETYNNYKSVISKRGEKVKNHLISYMEKTINDDKPNDKTLAAIEEIKEIRKNPDKYKAYTLDELFGEWDL